VSSRVLVIHRGRLRADGPPHELVAQGAKRRLLLTVHGTPAALAAALVGLPGSEASPPTAGADGTCSVALSLERGADPTAELGRRLLAAGLPVHELRIVLPTLEEYFHSITEGGDAAEEAAVQATAATGALS
jgi:ABC-type multidrug transport system ATPase subunit